MTELSTSISAATVYPDRVRLVRHGKITLEAGTHAVELPELPLTISPESLRATLYGATSARLLGVEVRRIFYSEQPSERVRMLEEEIEKKQDVLKRMEVRVELIRHNRQTLDKLADEVSTYATAIAAGEIDAEKQLDYFKRLRKEAEELDNEQLAIQSQQRRTGRELERLIKELEQVRNATPRERYTAVVNIDVQEARELTIEVSYIISEAGWKQLYDLRLVEKEGGPALEVTYLADVTQSTGETWEDVALTLSTARPALTSTLPELDPWYIHPPEPIYPAARLAVAAQAAPIPDTGGKMPQKALGGPLALFEEKSEEETAVVATSSTSVSYLIQSPVTIPPDGSAHKVTIARFLLTPVLDYVSAPKLAQAVFRRARVDNDSPYTLLPGEANVLIGDEYVGTTQLDLTVAGAGFELYLGIDNRIKAERELKRREVDKRVIGGKRSMAYGYEIKLESMLPGKANLTVYDQIPVSRNEDIKVKLEMADPKPTEQTELNLLVWKLLLEPKEKRTLRFDFVVESPQAMKIIGLP